MDIHVIRSEKPDFVILDRYNFCRALTLNLNRKNSVELEHLFLKVLNPS